MQYCCKCGARFIMLTPTMPLAQDESYRNISLPFEYKASVCPICKHKLKRRRI